MENSPRLQENQNPSLIPSPNSHSTNSTSSNNGLHHPSPPPTPTTPIPITRSEPNSPYPTTFVQADPSSFKQVVQMLTGSSEPANRPDPRRSHPIPPIKTGPKKQQPGSKLYERRNSLRNFRISPLPGFVHNSGYPTRKPEILSPSVLDFPSLVLSPVTPLIPDPFNRSSSSSQSTPGSCATVDMEAEADAIAKKGFYLHRSPAGTPRGSEPRLLPLFPVTSPRISGSS